MNSLSHFHFIQSTTLKAAIRTTLLLLALLWIASCDRPDGVSIRGEVKNLHQTDVLLYGFRSDTGHLLLSPVDRGLFSALVTPDSLLPVIILLDGETEIPVFAEKGDEVHIKGDMEDPASFTVEGGMEINEALNEWRRNKGKEEDLIKKHPDHPASAWLIVHLATTAPEIDITRLKRLTELLTPRMAESPLLHDLRNELSQPGFLQEVEIPYFGRTARTILRSATGEKTDSTYTSDQLTRKLRDLLRQE